MAPESEVSQGLERLAGIEVVRVTPQTAGPVRDQVVIERPVAIEVNGLPAALLMALPGDEEELAAGFALSEGIVRNRAELLLLRACAPPEASSQEWEGEHPLLVKVVVPVERLRSRAQKPVVRYACGTVGRSIAAHPPEPLSDGFRVSRAVLLGLHGQITRAPLAHRQTGGTHAAASFDSQGNLIILREDVGRHNAVDKVLGHCLLSGVPLEDKLLVTTGRASSELALKAITARVPVLAALSAPTSLAVRWAEYFGLTLIAFLRPRRMNIYAHPQRVTD